MIINPVPLVLGSDSVSALRQAKGGLPDSPAVQPEAVHEDEKTEPPAGSFPDERGALAAYKLLRPRLADDSRSYLRVELVKGYYTLRLGNFATKTEAARLLDQVRAEFPTALILRAYIKSERILMMEGQRGGSEPIAEEASSTPEVSKAVAEKAQAPSPLVMKASGKQAGEAAQIREGDTTHAQQVNTYGVDIKPAEVVSAPRQEATRLRNRRPANWSSIR